MSLDARRKAKATSSGDKAEKKTKKTQVKGPLRSIALGRQYQEWEPIVGENGAPVPRSYYDPAAHNAAVIPKDTSKTRVLNSSTFIRHLNATVAKSIFGAPLRGKIMRMLVEGIADQILALTEKGYTVKYPNFAVAKKVARKARKARNPRTGEAVQVEAHTTIAVKPTRSAKAYIRQSS